MTDDSVISFPLLDASDISARKNLKWLFVLRNLMICVEALAVIISVYGLELPLYQAALTAVITAQLGFNWYTWVRLEEERIVVDGELFFQLCCDVLTITAVLYFTGGASNPLAWFFLLPLILTSTILPRIYTWYMVLFTSACYTLLMTFYKPLPAILPITLGPNTPPELHQLMDHHDLQLHVFGMWFGFVFSAVLVAYFVVGIADTLRQRERKLAEIREHTLRNERVVALGTLAAGAAHEMGTPLGTMAIIVHELIKEYGETDADLCKKMKILREQVSRCKQALSVLSASAGEIRAESGHPMPVSAYLDEVISNWRQQRPEGVLAVNKQGFEPSPSILAELTLTHALVNILNNSADVSPHFIELRARWTKDRLVLEIVDDGPGIAPSVSEQLGKEPVSSKENGLGVGLFLAFTTIERMGGTISMALRSECQGTLTRISLPVTLREAGL
ncbi:ATP-binding protein [Candidatus Methylospira mobilis]|uniref:ATP-binding protein n=1 Tax=Candidatus Methylospira mobilis TaxID=1808979 RepID=UPI001D177737|nr:ATP-binding protein [Candidatus Methylospira mobilis]WNV03310.1 ATP-binding protein [Candidatus Methylospira mobilis]